MTTKTELTALTLLRSSEITQELDTEHLKQLAAVASEVAFEQGNIIYKEGEVGKAIYIILSGQIIIEMPTAKGMVEIHRLGAGDLFGWSSLFPSERKKAQARVVRPTRAIAIDAFRLRDAWQGDYELEKAMIQLVNKVMIDRIKAARQKLAEALAEEK